MKSQLLKSNNFSYCQPQIEGGKYCSQQCEHCKEYYAPLEEKVDNLISDDEIDRLSHIEILYNSDKRKWWVEGAKYINNFKKQTKKNEHKSS